MTTAPAKTNGHAAAPAQREPEGGEITAVEHALINGDLSRLSPAERLKLYTMRCEAAGLDPRSQPFQYILMPKGGLKLYATKAATDQLIAAQKLTVQILDRRYDEWLGCCVVHCRVTFPDGHSVEDVGVLAMGESLRGEDMANAVMKCVTKAKRRTVLSACGLGMLDESEVETTPEVRVSRAPEPPRKAIEAPAPSPRPVAPQSSPAPSSLDFAGRDWIERRVTAVNDNWANELKLAGKPPEKLISNVWQVFNALITTWIENEELRPDQVEREGKRKRGLVAQTIGEFYQARESEVQMDVETYLSLKEEEAARAAGINLDAEPEPPEETLTHAS